MPTAAEIRVSIDVGCHSHSVAIGLPTGDVLEEFDLQHRPEGFDLFFARVERCQRRYGGEVAVARAYLSGQHMMAAIARHFGVHYSTVSRTRGHMKSRWRADVLLQDPSAPLGTAAARRSGWRSGWCQPAKWSRGSATKHPTL